MSSEGLLSMKGCHQKPSFHEGMSSEGLLSMKGCHQENMNMFKTYEGFP
jgi:hypothetical protein